MISLHISYLVKQPIKTSVLFLNMVRMFILILQVKLLKFLAVFFCFFGIWLKTRFHYERNHISAYTVEPLLSDPLVKVTIRSDNRKVG